MTIEGINARRIIGADVETMGEFILLRFETDNGDFVVRLPAEEIQVALPNLLTVPGRAQAVADPIGSPTPPPGAPGKARALPAAAAVLQTATTSGKVLFELHIGRPPYPVFLSFSREAARRFVEQASRSLAESESGGS